RITVPPSLPLLPKLRPHRLPDPVQARAAAPALGQRGDQGESPAPFVVQTRVVWRRSSGAGVGYLDADPPFVASGADGTPSARHFAGTTLHGGGLPRRTVPLPDLQLPAAGGAGGRTARE